MDKWARTYLSCSRWSLIFFDRFRSSEYACCARAWSCFRFDEFRGLRRCRVCVVIPLIDNVVLQIKKIVSFPLLFVTHVNLTEEYSTILSSQLLFSKVCPSGYLLACNYVYISIGSWCAAFPFPPRNCLLLPLRISSGVCVGNLTRTRSSLHIPVCPGMLC